MRRAAHHREVVHAGEHDLFGVRVRVRVRMRVRVRVIG